jgi:hypothetical protein
MVSSKVSYMSKVWCLVLAVGLMSACGNDKGQVSANTPQESNQQGAYQQDCLQNNGYGCSWDHMPGGFTQFPRNNDGYYNYGQGGGQNSGYYSGYQHNNGGCAMGSSPVYRPGWGMACMPIQNPNQYYQQPWNGGNSMVYCNVLQPSCANGGNCVPMYQANPQYSNQWSNSNYVSWGVCSR